MKPIENEEKEASLKGMFDSEGPSPLPPMTPEGGFQGIINDGEPIPAAHPANFICLRGPCRYYFAPISLFEAGNPRGSLDAPPRQINRYCTRITGVSLDLADDCVFDCNAWDPMTSDEIDEREYRRRLYYEKNPDHDPQGEKA